jgi:hypothetical protein
MFLAYKVNGITKYTSPREIVKGLVIAILMIKISFY